MGKTLGYGEITVANMTEPFTVMLTNEAQQFATDSNRKVTSAQSYYTDIIVIRGSQERTDYTIGNITSGSGITVSKNSKRVTFSVSAGTTIGADAGVIEIPITLDGQTVKKQFSWSCGKQGPQGVKGNDGNSFAWNMLSETNCGKKHWGTASSGGKYSVEDFITEDNIDAVKLICTEAISTSNWSFVSFKDIKMLKQLKPSTKYTLSYDIKANRSGAISHSICKGDVSNFCTNTVVVNNIIGNETWQHISVVLTTNDLKTTPTNEILYLGRNALSKVGYSIIKNLKLVEGDIDTPWSPSQSDIEGKGVVETVQYYLATSQASGVTSSTSGWSTDITTQKLTADKKYLWNCYQTKYSDGTSEPISTPKVIGVYGDKGQKGENAKNLSITPSSQYFKSTDGGKTFAPDTIAIKPTIQGEISFGKWQYSIDGGVSFADVVSGQKGLTISNNVLTVNKDSSLYSDAVTMVTFRAVANDSSFYDTCSIAKIYDVSDIGDGRNLIQKSQLNPIDGAELSLDDYTKNGTVIFTNKSENSGFSFDSYNNYQPNSKYVLSYYFTKTSGTMNSFGGSHNGKGVVYTSFFVDDKVYDTASYAGGSSQIGTILNDGKRHRIVVCYTTPDTIATDTSVNYTFIQPGRGNTNPNFGVKIEELKLEKGSSPTGWSPAPEDLQTAILSTKSEISDVSLKVDNNKQAIEQRVEKTTYQQDLNLVEGDISKANEGLNKWRYEIYPKSLFADKPEDQSKYDIGVFIRNKNLTPSRTLVFDDNKWTLLDYENNYIGYGLTFVKMSAKKTFSTKWAHSSSCSIYVNGKLIISDEGTVRLDSNNVGRDFSCTFIEGWNCIEFVMQETTGNEWFFFKDAISTISECQLMNCYYGTPVARQSHITNQLVQNTTDIDGVSGSVQKVMSTVGGSGKIDEFVSNYSTWKKKVNGIETRVGETYTTKSDFDGLEIGGRNLVLNSKDTIYRDGKETDSDGFVEGYHIGNTLWNEQFYRLSIKNDDTTKYTAPITISAYVKAPNASLGGAYFCLDLRNSSNVRIADDNYALNNFKNHEQINEDTWTYVSFTTTSLSNDFSQNGQWDLQIKTNGSFATGAKFWYKKIKVEFGNKATDWTPAPEDINGKIQSVETIATQTADKFSWLVKSGTSSSNFELTDKTATLVASKINQYGLVTFNGLDDTTKDKINTTTGGNLITVTPANPKSDYGGGQTYNVTADDKGGRCVQWNSSCVSFLLLNSYTPVNFTSSDQLYYDIRVPNWSSTTFDTKLTIWFYNKNKANITSASKTLTLKSTIWNHFTGYLTLPSSSNWGDLYYYIIGLTNPNKQAIGITNDSYIERVNSYATTYAKNAVDWVGQNGTNTNNMYSMISKWANGAVSANTKINGGLIETDSILAKSIAIGDFANYSQLNHATASHFGFTTTDDSGGEWFTVKNMARDIFLNDDFYDCKPGDTFRIEFSISTSMKGNSKAGGTDSNYVGSTIGLYSFSADLSQSSIYYAQRITASANATETAVSSIVTIGAANRLKFRVFLQTESYGNWSGTLKIRNVTVRKMTTGNLIVDGAITANKIATDAIKSRNYISSGGTQGSFLNLSDGSFKSPNLSWDSNGNLIAKNANLSGEITAINGTIGKYEITDQWLTTGSGSTCTGMGGNQAFWAGGEDSNSAPFRVGYDGKLTSSNADITGTITATNGKIGRYDITSTYLMTNSGSNASGIGGNQAFWAGAEDSNSAPFRVGYDGVLWAENAAIRGSIETGNLGDEGDTVSIINGHIGIRGTSNNVEIYSTGFKFGIDGDYYLESVSEGVKCYRNLYATDFVADGWVYCSEVHSSGAVVIGADSESFYWAHGYQIGRGTSWGGVCLGDDSQQLRLYGSSIWASHSISTSDENLKENFTTLDQYEDFYMNLNPIGFNYIGDYDGKKTHFGFGAHKTEDILESEGYDADKFAVVTHRPLVQEDIEKRFGKDVEVDIETEYGVSYTEFIALNTHMIQKTRRELTKVKQEKANLEARLQVIEAKLGL